MTSIWAEIKHAAKEAPKMYFAPLIGAIRGIQSEYRRIDRERRRVRNEQINRQ